MSVDKTADLVKAFHQLNKSAVSMAVSFTAFRKIKEELNGLDSQRGGKRTCLDLRRKRIGI